MKTTDLFNNNTSKKINEAFKKTFNKELNLESFNLEQLQDARNRIRTQLSQKRTGAKFNENLENDAYHEAQWMLDSINAEIAERSEFIIDDEITEGWGAETQRQQRAEMDAERDEYQEKIKKENPELLGNYNAWTRSGTRGSAAYERVMAGRVHPLMHDPKYNKHPDLQPPMSKEMKTEAAGEKIDTVNGFDIIKKNNKFHIIDPATNKTVGIEKHSENARRVATAQ